MVAEVTGGRADGWTGGDKMGWGSVRAKWNGREMIMIGIGVSIIIVLPAYTIYCTQTTLTNIYYIIGDFVVCLSVLCVCRLVCLCSCIYKYI